MSFEASIAVAPHSRNEYTVDLKEDWCIGSVPNGGYVASVLLSAVRTHFAGTLSGQDQPDTISMQLQFLRRTSAGEGVVAVRDLKLGGGISVVQATLVQGGREEVTGLFTQSNFAKQTGLTLPTDFVQSCLSPAPPPVDLKALETTGQDAHWKLEANPPFSKFRKATRKLVFYHPRKQQHSSMVEQWIRFRPDGENLAPFTQEALGFVIDMYPMVVDRYPESADGSGPRWYPTVGMNLDVKKRLPKEGVKWLFVRARAAAIKDGRMDLQVIVMDDEGDVVGLSSHVTLISSSERNRAARRPGDTGKGKL